MWGFSPGVTISLWWPWVSLCSLFCPCTNTNCCKLYWILLLPVVHLLQNTLGLMFPISMAANVFLAGLISQITFFWPLGLNLRSKGCRHKANEWYLFLAQTWTGMIEYWWSVPHSPRLCIWIIQNLTDINCKWSLLLQNHMQNIKPSLCVVQFSVRALEGFSKWPT